MNIREQIENREKNNLSRYATLSQKSLGRDVYEKECEIRTCFSRDRDRIIHSKSFRRLKHKTQVFLRPEGDHYRTRLTHTLEVSQIAKTISKALCLNDDLVEAIALGHDLGHTPFGHTGERVLNRLLKNGFEHCEQSLRIVEKLEKNGKGLNLTKEVRDGILNHRTKGNPFTIEGQVVRISDKIAYINHDIDDAISAKIILNEDIPIDICKVLGYTVHDRINTLIIDLVENSKDSPQIKQSNEVKEAMDDLRKWLFTHLYTNSIAKKEEKKAEKLIEMLYEYYSQNVDLLPQEYICLIDKNENVSQVVADYIAGMTDDYAVNQFNSIFIPKGWEY